MHGRGSAKAIEPPPAVAKGKLNIMEITLNLKHFLRLSKTRAEITIIPGSDLWTKVCLWRENCMDPFASLFGG